MLENDEIIEKFKKSLTASVKSIGKSEQIFILFWDGSTKNHNSNEKFKKLEQLTMKHNIKV